MTKDDVHTAAVLAIALHKRSTGHTHPNATASLALTLMATAKVARTAAERACNEADYDDSRASKRIQGVADRVAAEYPGVTVHVEHDPRGSCLWLSGIGPHDDWSGEGRFCL